MRKDTFNIFQTFAYVVSKVFFLFIYFFYEKLVLGRVPYKCKKRMKKN